MPRKRPREHPSCEEKCVVPTNECRNWFNLSNDILGSILERLSFKHQIRFRSVCKGWRQATHGLKPDYKFPWLFSFKRYSTRPKYNLLYNPCSRATYYIKNKTKHHRCRENKFTYAREIVAVKSGWMLTRESCSCGYGLTYLYNPFAQEVVNLPELPSPILSEQIPLMKFTFSHCSKRRCFEVYGALLIEGVGSIDLITWRTGCEEWEHDSFRMEPHYERRIRYKIYKLELIKGILYCVFSSGTVVTLKHDGAEKLLHVVVNHETDGWIDGINGIPDDVVVCEEELLLFISLYREACEIWRLDLSQKAWTKEVSLGNRVLFLGLHASSTHSLMLPVGENTKDLAGRVYYNNRYNRHYDINFCHFIVYNESESAAKPAFPWPNYYPSKSHAVWIEPPNRR